eukprot:822334-Pelagomonas_calceolata.AAC.2
MAGRHAGLQCLQLNRLHARLHSGLCAGMPMNVLAFAEDQAACTLAFRLCAGMPMNVLAFAEDQAACTLAFRPVCGHVDKCAGFADQAACTLAFKPVCGHVDECAGFADQADVLLQVCIHACVGAC